MLEININCCVNNLQHFKLGLGHIHNIMDNDYLDLEQDSQLPFWNCTNWRFYH